MPHKVSVESMVSEMRRRIKPLAVEPDDWVRRMMHWHFSDDTGSPFWLQQRASLKFDPLRDVQNYEDLNQFGLFDKDLLRKARVADLIPRGFADRPRRVFETGGTTGAPCRIIDVTTGQYNVAAYRVMLAARGLEGGDILGMTPSGPHAYGTFVTRLAQSWRGQAFLIDFDPRYVKLLLRSKQSIDQYLQHIIDQTRLLLESQQPKLLFTTSKLLTTLVLSIDKQLSDYGVRGVCTGGTSCTPEEIRYITENYLDSIQWIDTYGNTLMGHALQGDSWKDWGQRAYYLLPPLARIRVVDTNDWAVEVDRGDRGRVLISTLLEDLFIPNLLERDSAIRVGPHPWFPWDGVSCIEPFAADDLDATEGVY